MKNKLSLNPPKREMPTPEEFVSSANRPPKEQADTPKPWEDERVRDDVILMVSLRMPEPYIMKLRYLSEKTNKSQQQILREVILPFIDAEIEKY